MSKRIYLMHPERPDAVSVRTGFNWPACLLGCMWALSKRLWRVAIALLVANILIAMIGIVAPSSGSLDLILSIALAIYCGVAGNRWHRQALERRGYVVLP